MNKTKYLLKNLSFLVFGQFGIKVLNLILVPIYTNILTTSEYGTYDLICTAIGLLIPILTLNIRDSAMLFALDNKNEKEQVFSISIRYGFFSILWGLTIIIINEIFGFSQMISDYKYYILLLFLSQVMNGIVTSFVRGLDQLKHIAISGVICAISIIISNIITLLFFGMGIKGYFIANIIGPSVQIIYLFIVCKCWRYFTMKFDISLSKEMTKYSKPLILNSTAWWVNSFSDRFLVSWLCGTSATGIYSVANKIPSILDSFQSIFGQAWTLSAVKEFDPEDRNSFFTNMYNTYNVCFTFGCSVLIMVSRLLASLLYAKDFFLAWKYVPFLLIAVLFGALAGYSGAIFSATKKSKTFAISTIIGGITNIVLNFLLIPYLEALGAAIATAVCYWVIYAIRIKHVKKLIILRTHLIRDSIAYIVLFIQSFSFLLIKNETWYLYGVQGCLFVIIVLLFKDQIAYLKNEIFGLIKRKLAG